MRVALDEFATLPKRAHSTDAGLDLYSRNEAIVPAHGSATFDTGVHIELPHNTAGVLVSKSGLNVNHGITSTGLIDEGYTGPIKVKLYNHSNIDYFVKKGAKISQLVIMPVSYVQVEVTDSILSDSDRGTNGFGSTGE